MGEAVDAAAGGPPDVSELGAAFELSAVPMILLDESDQVACANAAADRLFAVPMIGHRVAELQVPITSEADPVSWWPAAPANSAEFQIGMITGPGARVEVDVRTDVLTTPSGKRFVLGQVRDVTAERQQLAADEMRYRQLIDNLPDASVLLVDRDLRVHLAAGEELIASGYDPAALEGQLLSDAVPARAWELLRPRYHEMLAGQAIDFEYDSPVDGRQFRVRARPVIGADSSVVGGLLMSEDVSEDRARRSQLEQVERLGAFGSCRFDRTSGWSFDTELSVLWGIVDAADFTGLPMDLVPADQRAAVQALWAEVLRTAGRHTLRYRIRHGRTGRTVHLQSTHETVIDPDGRLMRVVSSHVDVTEAVLAGERADQQRAAAAEERLILLRRVTDSLATSSLGPEGLMASIANLAATTIGEGAAIRILSPDLRTIERDVIAHPNEPARIALEEAMQRSQSWPVPRDGIPGEVIGKGALIARIRPDGWRPYYHRLFTERIVEAADFMIAPVRHNGAVLGMLSVIRSDPDAPYRPGDDDVLQVLADAAGAAVAETRLSRQHHGLLEELAGMETRERYLLAESIHDEPIQHLAAGIMRLDYLSAHVDPATREELDRVAGQLEITAGWLRNLIMVALNPPELTAGLGPALASLARGIFTDTPTVITTLGPDHVPLTVPAKETAYRIFREAMLNVRKHARASAVTLRFDERDDVVVLSLSDDGIGCATLDSGPHLGIATMRARARAEGGHLNVESLEGLGTTVTLTLPRRAAVLLGEPPVNAVTQHGRSSDLNRTRTVVVVDDQQEIRSAVGLLLADFPGVQLVGDAVDGATCLDRINDLRPDALIMDFSMPGGGPHLVKAAKRICPGLHIIVFTGRQDTRTRDAMLDAGADQYVVKTGRLRLLAEALDRAFAGGSPIRTG